MRVSPKELTLKSGIEAQVRSRQLTNESTISLETAETFAQFYARVHLQVFRYLCGVHGGSQEEAEDLTAETFLRAWKSRHRFRGTEGAAIGWVFKIARHLVIDAHRRKKVRGIFEDFSQIVLLATDADPETHAMLSEQQEVLWKAMQHLSVKQREMVVLRYMLGWPVNQIANHLGMTENTVSVNIRRALKHLREDEVWTTKKNV